MVVKVLDVGKVVDVLIVVKRLRFFFEPLESLQPLQHLQPLYNKPTIAYLCF